MKVNRIQSTIPVRSVEKVKPKHLEKNKGENGKLLDDTAMYEPSEQNKKPTTYTKNGHIYDHEAVTKLKKQSEQAHAYLISLIEKLLLKQGHSIKTITAEQWAEIEIDDETRLEAQKMIEPGGPLSAEVVSDRIVDFAKAISGGDVEKLDKLKDAIKEGFEKAKAILGELPEVSKQTYELIMEKLDTWANESDELVDIDED